MPIGVPKRGYRVTKKLEGKTLADIERELAFRVPDLVAKLEEMTKALRCPNCGVEVKQVDRDAIIYLIDRAMGKPTQRTEVDITQQVVLSADQIDRVLARYQIASQAIEGEYKLIGGSNNGSNKDTEDDIPEGVHEEAQV